MLGVNCLIKDFNAYGAGTKTRKIITTNRQEKLHSSTYHVFQPIHLGCLKSPKLAITALWAMTRAYATGSRGGLHPGQEN